MTDKYRVIQISHQRKGKYGESKKIRRAVTMPVSKTEALACKRQFDSTPGHSCTFEIKKEKA